MKKNLYSFFYYLYLYLLAGIPLSQAILYYSDRCDKEFKPIVAALQQSIHNGKKLHEALAEHKIFSAFIVQTLHFADKSGQTKQALAEIVFYLEQQADLKRKIMMAIMPICVLLLSMAISIGAVIFFVIPAMVNVISDVGAELPLLTRMVVFVDNIFVTCWPIFLVGFIAAGIMSVYVYNNKKDTVDKIKWKLPFYKGIYRNLLWYRMSKILSLLSKNDIPYAESLQYTANAVDDTQMQAILTDAKDNIPRGMEAYQAIAKANEKAKLIDELMLLFIEAGIEAGQLPEALNNISELYRKNLLGYTEEIGFKISISVILPCAVILGIIVASIYLPLSNFMNATANMMQ